MLKNRIFAAVILLFLVLTVIVVIALPPEPHNVGGKVFHSDGITGAENDIPLMINNTDSFDFILTYVSAPLIPSLKGIYSAVINGSDGDNIIVSAWNSTHYGINTSVLGSTTTEVNVILNTTRSSETNTTLLSLNSNSIFNISGISQISVKVGIIGGENGVDCYAKLNIINTSILDLSTGTYTNYLGNIDLGSSTSTSWSIVGLSEGSTDINVNSYCGSDGVNFDHLDYSFVYNLTLSDTAPPIIELKSPLNNSAKSYFSNPVSFVYNATDDSLIANCSLVINNIVNQTNYNIQKGVGQYFYQNMGIGNYSWSITCVDNGSSRISGYSPTYNLSVVPNRKPSISNLAIDDPISLNQGNIKIVYCNASVSDEDNVSDLKNISSTLYHISVESYSPDDNNNHYTNNTCQVISSSEFERNYSCGFPVNYYSNPGIWSCNITAYDYSNISGSSRIDTNIDDLIALDVSSSMIEYGELEAGNISREDFNLTLTNLGNIDINISLKGFAVTEGDGLSMDCEKSSIPIGYQRYSLSFGEDYNDMLNLTVIPQQIANFTLLQRTNDTNYKNDRNNTYWKLRIPYNTIGQCTGTVNFLAVPD